MAKIRKLILVPIELEPKIYSISPKQNTDTDSPNDPTPPVKPAKKTKIAKKATCSWKTH